MAELTNQYILDKLIAKFGSSIISHEEQYGMLSVTASRDSNIEILRFLWDESDLEFQFMTDLCGVHYPDAELQLVVVYHLHSLVKNVRFRLKFGLPIENPTIRTATTVYETANWMERETYDFFGILFEGHPNLCRILNIDSMEVFPLRKEYPLEDPNRIDKKDHFFGR
jgi:NADH-quinone oxidoreductase subunit C